MDSLGHLGVLRWPWWTAVPYNKQTEMSTLVGLFVSIDNMFILNEAQPVLGNLHDMNLYLESLRKAYLWKRGARRAIYEAAVRIDHHTDTDSQAPQIRDFLQYSNLFFRTAEQIPRHINKLSLHGDIESYVIRALKERLSELDEISKMYVHDVKWSRVSSILPERMDNILARKQLYLVEEVGRRWPDHLGVVVTNASVRMRQAQCWNPSVVGLAVIFAVGSMYATAQAMNLLDPEQATPSTLKDPNFFLLIQCSALQALGLFVGLISILNSPLEPVASTIAWISSVIGPCAIGSSIWRYVSEDFALSILLSFLASLCQIIVIVELTFIVKVYIYSEFIIHFHTFCRLAKTHQSLSFSPRRILLTVGKPNSTRPAK